MHFQLLETPEDFFVDIVSRYNFLVDNLHVSCCDIHSLFHKLNYFFGPLIIQNEMYMCFCFKTIIYLHYFNNLLH